MVLSLTDLLEEGLVVHVAQTKPMCPEGINVGLDGGDDPLKFRFTKNAQAFQERNPWPSGYISRIRIIYDEDGT